MEPASRSLAIGGAARSQAQDQGPIRAVAPEPQLAPRPLDARPITVAGKFLALGGEPFFLRGVTYGPFAPDASGCEYKTESIVASDFARMAAHGINTIRTYTPPPAWLLDRALEHGLRVMVGLPWEQHVTFLDSRSKRRSIRDRVRHAIADCNRHPAILAYAVGNEIPAPIARWHGRRHIERWIESLYEVAKDEHPESLVTYVNYPTTEYLELPFLDFFAWNVYLERPDKLARYLARLQNLAGERPLVLAEVGLDSQRNGVAKQAEVLDWQVRTAGAAGCAGAILFSWTDEWHRSGAEIFDWDFGLTDRERKPKPALAAAQRAFAEFPFAESADWPFVSVVVCSYNGSRTLRETLAALERLDYPRYEVLVIDDGSTDATASIAREFVHEPEPGTPPDARRARFAGALKGAPVRLISTENRGLSNARNLGMREARGEIVAYIDDDAYPQRLWLRYLAHTFMTTDHVAVGGPNVCPATDSEIARCVSHSPGGPNHVLITDTVAEHIPGCNMAFRRQALLDIGGFDPQFRIAGDDVDLCWRLHDAGGTIGFHAAAMVWHHSRDKVRAYLRQQFNYGRAEAMLENTWPAKYNAAGHPRWTGRLYGRGRREAFGLRRSRVHHGVWGSGLFQSLYSRQAGVVESLPLTPEWYLVVVVLALLSLAGALWPPLLWSLPALVLAAAPLLSQSISAARHAPIGRKRSKIARWRKRALIAWLHLLQPTARLRGRLSYGLHPLRRTTGGFPLVMPRRRIHTLWSENWRSMEKRLEEVEQTLHSLGARTVRGGAFDEWDLEVRGGIFAGVRLLMGIEEHGHGRQLVRIKLQPAPARWAAPLGILLVPLLLLALAIESPTATAAVLTVAVLLVGRAIVDSAAASSVALKACRALAEDRASQLGAAHGETALEGEVASTTVEAEESRDGRALAPGSPAASQAR